MQLRHLALVAVLFVALASADPFNAAYATSELVSTFDTSNGQVVVDIDPQTGVEILATAAKKSPPPRRRPPPRGPKLCPSGYRLLWSDEFNNWAAFDDSWSYERGNGCEYGICGWGNQEMEWYTDRKENVKVSGGELKITARATTENERIGCCGDRECGPEECLYTSARVRTFGKFTVGPSAAGRNRSIRIQTRVRLPEGEGLWPSIWMLPAQSPANCSGCGAYGKWAASGAITLAQSTNLMTQATGGILFGGEFPSQTSSTFGTKLRGTSSGYHTFTFDWSLDKMRWVIDGKKVFEAYSGKGGSVPNGWFTSGAGAGPNSPFDKPFYLILNLAVGGTGTEATAEQVANTLVDPKEMGVDYVRVCTR